MAVVAADRHAAAKVGGGADLAEVVVAAELAVGVAGDLLEQEPALDVGGMPGLVEEGPGEPAGAVRHRPADHPLEDLEHGSFATGEDGRQLVTETVTAGVSFDAASDRPGSAAN